MSGAPRSDIFRHRYAFCARCRLHGLKLNCGQTHHDRDLPDMFVGKNLRSSSHVSTVGVMRVTVNDPPFLRRVALPFPEAAGSRCSSNGV